jgi:hypothetical protein
MFFSLLQALPSVLSVIRFRATGFQIGSQQYQGMLNFADIIAAH